MSAAPMDLSGKEIDEAQKNQPPSTSGSNASSASSRRNQRKRKAKGGAAAANNPQTSSQTAAVASRNSGHSHSHGGGGHDHPHSGGGHSHGGPSHSHSHDGQPCTGHGGHDILSPFGDIDPDDMAEAVHYCDVCWHYQSYRQHAFQKLERQEADFHVIPSVLQSLVPTFNEKMSQLRAGVIANATFIQEILKHRYVFHNTQEIDYSALEEKVAREHPIDGERMGRVRSTIRQCVRDWSVEGAAERATCYGPILSELERLFPSMESRKGMKVLVPGSGLGRLVWECASRGFEATGCEFSYQMLMCSFLILNCCKAPGIFTIFPYIHESKNLVDEADSLRSVTIPDVDPTSLPSQGKLSMAAGDWMDIFSDLPQQAFHNLYQKKMDMTKRRLKAWQEKQNREYQAKQKSQPSSSSSSSAAAASASSKSPLQDESDSPYEHVPDPIRHTTGPQSNKETWDVFASCYFIDCATNILEFLRTIAYILKPGGYWVNFGPLLYHFSDIENEVSVDLTWKELRRAIPYFGLELVREELNQPSSYTLDDRSMLRQEYFCVSCTWKKVGEDWTTKPLALRPALPEPQSVAWQSRLAGGNEVYSNVAIDAQEPKLTKLLTVLLAKPLRSTTTPSGTPITVWALPSGKLGTFLMQACDVPGVSLGKMVIEQVEVMGALKK